MALATIQDISIITTPPVGRKPIKTEVSVSDWNLVAKAVNAELARNGQVYFVHNRVQELPSLLVQLEKVLPGVRIVVAHGQMAEGQLSNVIRAFHQHKHDLLLCTTIIENGLDIPNVNTIIINNAQRFGLSQLYQMRGRVGRGDKQAYCYLFFHKSSKSAVSKQRISAIAEANELGAGFKIASQDLEIRGAGNLLGDQQHGHIASIGYGLYMQLLGQEIEKLKQLQTDVSGILSF